MLNRLHGMIFSKDSWGRDGEFRFGINIGQYDAKDLEDLEVPNKKSADFEEVGVNTVAS
jgi:hypothetical protein